MNELQVFTNPEFGQVRTVTIEEEPWFVGKDVAVALGYSNTKDALHRHVDPEDKGGAQITTPSGEQTMTIINESGLYALIFGSKLESAKRFKHWVTSEVLPSIRRHGAYMTDELLEQAAGNPAIRKTGSYSIIPKARALTTDDYMKAAQLAATCRNERLPYVLGFLEQAGFNIPEVTATPPALDGPVDCTEIQRLMDERGISVTELSKLTNICKASLSYYKRGIYKPNRERYRIIIDALT